MENLVVEVYSKKDCSKCASAKGADCELCREAVRTIGRVKIDIPFLLKEIDIDLDEDLCRRYREDIPTIFINGKKAFKFKVDELEFRKKIRKELIKAGMAKFFKKRQYNS